LSFLTIIVGLLYMEHGRGQRSWVSRCSRPCALRRVTLLRASKAYLELCGGLLPRSVCSLIAPVAFNPRWEHAVAYFTNMARTRRESLPAAPSRELAIVYSTARYSLFLVAGGGDWSLDRYARPHPSSALSAEPVLSKAAGQHDALLRSEELFDMAGDGRGLYSAWRSGQLSGSACSDVACPRDRVVFSR